MGKLFMHSERRCLPGLRSRLGGARRSMPPFLLPPSKHPTGVQLRQPGFLPRAPSRWGWQLPRAPLLPFWVAPMGASGPTDKQPYAGVPPSGLGGGGWSWPSLSGEGDFKVSHPSNAGAGLGWSVNPTTNHHRAGNFLFSQNPAAAAPGAEQAAAVLRNTRQG